MNGGILARLLNKTSGDVLLSGRTMRLTNYAPPNKRIGQGEYSHTAREHLDTPVTRVHRFVSDPGTITRALKKNRNCGALIFSRGVWFW